MATATFHIELRVQNVETEEHISALGMALEQAASLINSHAIMILGKACDPQIEAYGENFANGRWEIKLLSPDEVE